MSHFPRSRTYKGSKDAVVHNNNCTLDATSALGKLLVIATVCQGRSCKTPSQIRALIALQNFCELTGEFSVSLIKHEDDTVVQVSAGGHVDLGMLEHMLDSCGLTHRRGCGMLGTCECYLSSNLHVLYD